MAMNADGTGLPAVADHGASGLLHQAAHDLRQHTDQGWIRTRGSLLDALAAAVRPGRAVRAGHPDGDFHVSTTVLRTVLARALAGDAGVTLLRVAFDVEDERLVAVTADASARYGRPLLAGADRLRGTALAALRSVLGTDAPHEAAVAVHVVVTDVHLGPRW